MKISQNYVSACDLTQLGPAEQYSQPLCLDGVAMVRKYHCRAYFVCVPVGRDPVKPANSSREELALLLLGPASDDVLRMLDPVPVHVGQ